MQDHSKKQYPVIINGKFYNKQNDDISGTLSDMIIHYTSNWLNQEYKKFVRPQNLALPYQLTLHLLDQAHKQNDEISIILLGHATCLLTYRDLKIIFDPILYKSSFFFSRFTESIPKQLVNDIDIILYSHDHPDHFNLNDHIFLTTHTDNIVIFTPLKMEEEIPKTPHSTVYSHTWWEEKTITIKNHEITAYCLPAMHWAQSTLSNRNTHLWCSWLIKINEKYIFFGGDTAYSDHFKTIAHYFPHIDVALISIAPYLPIEMQFESHLDPESAFQAYLDLKKPIFIPIHWGTFAYGEEPIKEPIQKIIALFHQAGELHKLQATTLHTRYIIQ
jgi:L-ascorbate metabolism protein UlaG (beta-lactamase superfamily)